MPEWIDVRRAVPWLGTENIYLVRQEAMAELLKTLSSLGFSIVVLDGRKITTEHELLASIASALAFPDYFGMNWDAFVDSFGELANGKDRRRALVWSHADVSLDASLYVFLKGAHALLDAAIDLQRTKDATPVQLEVFFVGDVRFPKQPQFPL